MESKENIQVYLKFRFAILLGFLSSLVFAEHTSARTIKTKVSKVTVVVQPPTIFSGEWTELPNTKVRAVLPNPISIGTPAYMIDAWNGAAVDTKRNRLIIAGGGHADYWGNEIYAFDIAQSTVTRLTDPSVYTYQPKASEVYPPGGPELCPTSLPDGTPASRHTYAGIVYADHADKLLIFGGSRSPCGFGSQDLWSFSFATNKWKLENNSVAVFENGVAKFGIDGLAIVAAYDPVSKFIYIHDSHGFYSYNLDTNTLTRIAEQSLEGYHMSGAIDTKRRKMIVAGNDAMNTVKTGTPGEPLSRPAIVSVDLATGQRTELITTGGDNVLKLASPGISYDRNQDRLIAWAGGKELYSLNFDTRVWTKITPPSGPTFAALSQGTFARFSFVPALGVHVILNSIDENIYVYKP